MNCIKAGASDFILKENIEKLPIAVSEAYRKSRELREKEAHYTKIRNNEQHFKIITESSRDVLFMCNLNLQYKYVSPGIEFLTGYTVEEIMQMHIIDHLPEEDEISMREILRSELENELAGKNPKNHFRKVQFRQYHKEGNLIWVEAVVRFLQDEKGRPRKFWGGPGHYRTKNLHNKLAERESFLNFSHEIGGMGAWEYDVRNNKVYWSENNYRLLGLEPFSILPDNAYFHSRIHSEDLESVKNIMNSLQSDPEKLSYEYRIIMPDKSIRYFFSNAVPVFEQEELVRLKGINLDITAQKAGTSTIDSNFRLQLLLMPPISIYDHDLESGEIL